MKPTWDDIERLSETEPIIATYLKAMRLDHLTREEALIGMVSLLSFTLKSIRDRLIINLQRNGAQIFTLKPKEDLNADDQGGDDVSKDR